MLTVRALQEVKWWGYLEVRGGSRPRKGAVVMFRWEL